MQCFALPLCPREVATQEARQWGSRRSVSLALGAAKIVTHVASEALALGVGERRSLALPPQGPLLPPAGASSLLARAAADKTQIQRLGTPCVPSLSLPSHLGHGFASQPPARGQGGSLLPPAFRISLALSSSHLPLDEQTWPPRSTCLRDEDQRVPRSSLLKVLLQHHKHIWWWFPLGRLQIVAALSPHVPQPAPSLPLPAPLLPGLPLATVLLMLLSSATSTDHSSGSWPGRGQRRCSDCMQRRAEVSWGQEVGRIAWVSLLPPTRGSCWRG